MILVFSWQHLTGAWLLQMISNCLLQIILLYSVLPGSSKLRNSKYLVTFWHLLCAAHDQVDDLQDWAVVSISWCVKGPNCSPETLTQRHICLEHLFPYSPFCSVAGGSLEYAFIFESSVHYYPSRFIISWWGRAPVHHCKVISFSYCRCWEEGWPADSKIAWYWWALGFVTVVKHTSFDSCLCMEKTIDD